MSQNTMYNIMRLNGLWLRAHESKSPSTAAGSELSRNRKKITKMKGGFGQLSHGLGPFHTGDLQPVLAAVMARPANYDFYFMIPGARLIPPLSGTDGPSRSSTNYIPWVIAHDHEDRKLNSVNVKIRLSANLFPYAGNGKRDASVSQELRQGSG